MTMIDSIGKKFTLDLADIYDAEHRFLIAQEKMHAKANSSMLREMLSEHIAQTRQQIANLESIYTILGAAPVRSHCLTASGLVDEGDAQIKNAEANMALRDSVIATAVTKVEHFEIACYRNLIASAEHFDQPPIVDLLRRNLEQEEQTAHKAEDGYKDLLHYAISTQRLQSAVGDKTPLM